MTKSDIRVCEAWESEHERPVYALSSTCPECGAETVNSAPAPFGPGDSYGKYRRRARPDGPDDPDDA